MSHVHWDHVGNPSDFTKSKFIVGHGSLELLAHGADPTTTGGHSFYEVDLLPKDRKIELRRIDFSPKDLVSFSGIPDRLKNAKWLPLAHLPHTIELFNDGSVYLVDAPGHLEGHTNLIVRTKPKAWVYLGGDAYHDRRIIRKEVDIAEWKGPHGETCCIHVNKKVSIETIDRIRTLEEMQAQKVEVVLAHDSEWLQEEGNKSRFWPGKL